MTVLVVAGVPAHPAATIAVAPQTPEASAPRFASRVYAAPIPSRCDRAERPLLEAVRDSQASYVEIACGRR